MGNCKGYKGDGKCKEKKVYKDRRPTNFNRFEDLRYNISAVITKGENVWDVAIFYWENGKVKDTKFSDGFDSFEKAKKYVNDEFYLRRHR